MSIEFTFGHGQIAICSDRGFIKIKGNSGILYCPQNALVNLGLAITADLWSAAILATEFNNMFETNCYRYILQLFFSLSIFILIVVASPQAKIKLVFTAQQNYRLDRPYTQTVAPGNNIFNSALAIALVFWLAIAFTVSDRYRGFEYESNLLCSALGIIAIALSLITEAIVDRNLWLNFASQWFFISCRFKTPVEEIKLQGELALA